MVDSFLCSGATLYAENLEAVHSTQGSQRRERGQNITIVSLDL